MSLNKFFLSLAVVLLFCVSCKQGKNNENQTETIQKKEDTTELEPLPFMKNDEEKQDLANIHTLTQKEVIPFLTKYGKKHPADKIRIITNFGNITVKLFKDTPLHRANFIRLVKLGYFNTTFFHRVSKGFVIQGGNSDRWLTADFREAIGDYLLPNEASPEHTHVYGAFAMAKFLEQNVSDASSPFEFYIVQNKNGAHHLDGEHTVFGKVIEGMDVVDSIAQVKVGDSEWPIQNVFMDIEIVK